MKLFKNILRINTLLALNTTRICKKLTVYSNRILYTTGSINFIAIVKAEEDKKVIIFFCHFWILLSFYTYYYL